MRVFSVVGNRPQFIKSAPLSVALRDAGIDEVVLHTGQHWDPGMSQVFFDELEIAPPKYALDLRTSDPEPMAAPIADAIAAETPDWVLVYGDTNSTLAGALAAGDRPVAHVEAGLRSFDLSMPEEHNRIAVDRLSTLLFCPDERSAEQLAQEGVAGERVVVGDVMADATRLFAPHAPELDFERPYVALTIHRAANTERDRLRAIVEALGKTDARFMFPVHPRTGHALAAFGLELPPNVEAIEPLGYLEMLSLVRGAAAVVTDSGGVQKEAYWLGVPCVTVRPSTEWVDTVAAGANRLAEPEEIPAALAAASFPADPPPLYGDGRASGRIADALYAWTPK
jgi:UDP-N-acetylglucosamine 2-epimerase